jgi:glycosyltransferase involved in cell wall biosynthesis
MMGLEKEEQTAISVVIPTYERPFLLKRLLHSIAKQTYTHFEVHVIDDASSQEKEYRKVLEDFEELIPVLTYTRNGTNRGPCYTRNRGIDIANGSWIALVDDDDEWKPTKLEKQVALIQKVDRKVGIIYTWCEAIDERKVVWEYRNSLEGEVLPELLKECFIPSPSALVKREALLVAGCFDPRMPSCQDWDMWTRICSKGYEVACVKSVETLYHKHSLPTVGTSPKAPLGYELFWEKHKHLYKKYHPYLYYKKEWRRFLSSFFKGKRYELNGR